MINNSANFKRAILYFTTFATKEERPLSHKDTKDEPAKCKMCKSVFTFKGSNELMEHLIFK